MFKHNSERFGREDCQNMLEGDFGIQKLSVCCDHGFRTTKHSPLLGYNAPEVVKNGVRVGLSSPVTSFCVDEEHNHKVNSMTWILKHLVKTGQGARRSTPLLQCRFPAPPLSIRSAVFVFHLEIV